VRSVAEEFVQKLQEQFQSFKVSTFRERSLKRWDLATLKPQRSRMNSKTKPILALVLAITIAATGCSAQWINIALQDLPVLTQMALNIATVVSTLASGQQASTADVAVIDNISAQASRDLNLLQTLYNEYKAGPSATTLQKIQNVIAGLNQNLPTLLQSAHISNATLSARITAAVNLILTTVNSFAALMPQSSATTSRKATAAALLGAKDLKKQWNQQVCAPTGNPALDAAFEQSELR
jgi:hypothetical protein